MIVEKRKTKAAASPPTIEQIQERKTRERLTAYRDLVARAAAGEQLPGELMEQVEELLDALGLPPYAWERDVQGKREDDAAALEEVRLRDAEPQREARQRQLVEQVTKAEAELNRLRLELRQVSVGEQGKIVNVMRRRNELKTNHPHVLCDIEQAVAFRLQAKRKAMMPATPTGSRDVEGWG